MITKGLIKSIDITGNTCTVRMPLFETAGNDEIVSTAAISNTPGSYNGYKVGDVVWVGFENDQMDSPVVIGKLYLGVAKEKADPRGSLNVIDSIVSEKASVPFDTKLSSDIGDNVAKTQVPYNSLDAISNEVNSIKSELGEMDRSYGNEFKRVMTNMDEQGAKLQENLDKSTSAITEQFNKDVADMQEAISGVSSSVTTNQQNYLKDKEAVDSAIQNAIEAATKASEHADTVGQEVATNAANAATEAKNEAIKEALKNALRSLIDSGTILHKEEINSSTGAKNGTFYYWKTQVPSDQLSTDKTNYPYVKLENNEYIWQIDANNKPLYIKNSYFSTDTVQTTATSYPVFVTLQTVYDESIVAQTTALTQTNEAIEMSAKKLSLVTGADLTELAQTTNASGKALYYQNVTEAIISSKTSTTPTRFPLCVKTDSGIEPVADSTGKLLYWEDKSSYNEIDLLDPVGNIILDENDQAKKTYETDENGNAVLTLVYPTQTGEAETSYPVVLISNYFTANQQAQANMKVETDKITSNVEGVRQEAITENGKTLEVISNTKSAIEQTMNSIASTVAASSKGHATNEKGQPLYWTKDPNNNTVTNSDQTTTATEWPVYTDLGTQLSQLKQTADKISTWVGTAIDDEQYGTALDLITKQAADAEKNAKIAALKNSLKTLIDNKSVTPSTEEKRYWESGEAKTTTVTDYPLIEIIDGVPTWLIDEETIKPYYVSAAGSKSKYSSNFPVYMVAADNIDAQIAAAENSIKSYTNQEVLNAKKVNLEETLKALLDSKNLSHKRDKDNNLLYWVDDDTKSTTATEFPCIKIVDGKPTWQYDKTNIKPYYIEATAAQSTATTEFPVYITLSDVVDTEITKAITEANSYVDKEIKIQNTQLQETKEMIALSATQVDSTRTYIAVKNESDRQLYYNISDSTFNSSITKATAWLENKLNPTIDQSTATATKVEADDLISSFEATAYPVMISSGGSFIQKTYTASNSKIYKYFYKKDPTTIGTTTTTGKYAVYKVETTTEAKDAAIAISSNNITTAVQGITYQTDADGNIYYWPLGTDGEPNKQGTPTTTKPNVSDANLNKFKVKITDSNSIIEQTAAGIRQEVSNSVSGLGSTISQTAEEIRQEVSNSVSGLETSISQTAEGIRNAVLAKDGKGNTTGFGWDLSDSHWQVGPIKSGSLTPVLSIDKDGLTVEGKITATSGTIGGCSITEGKLQVAAANITSIDASKINTGELKIGDKFSASKTNTTVSIGGFTVNNSSLTAGSSGTDNYIKLGTDELKLGTHFSVTKAGELKADKGTFGGFTLSSTGLSGGTMSLSTSQLKFGDNFSLNSNGILSGPVKFLETNGNACGTVSNIADSLDPRYLLAFTITIASNTWKSINLYNAKTSLGSWLTPADVVLKKRIISVSIAGKYAHGDLYRPTDSGKGSLNEAEKTGAIANAWYVDWTYAGTTPIIWLYNGQTQESTASVLVVLGNKSSGEITSFGNNTSTGGGGCFEAGTKVLMADYSEKNIEELNVGDHVISYNRTTHEFEEEIIENWYLLSSTESAILHFDDGTVIKTTPTHPFLTTDGWVSLRPDHNYALQHEDLAYQTVSMMREGQDFIAFEKNSPVTKKLISIEKTERESFDVYNLNISHCNTFIVNGVVCHNVAVKGY